MSNSIKYKSFATATLLKAAIGKALLNAESARSKLQIVLIAAEYHYLEHGDYTLVNDLVVGLDELKGYNAAPMIKHVEKHIGLTCTEIVTDAIAGKTEMPKGFNGHTGQHSQEDEHKLELIEGAKAEMWWDTIPQTSAFEMVVPEKIVLAAIRKAKRKVKAAEKAANDSGKPLSEFLDNEFSAAGTTEILEYMGVNRAVAA